MKRAFTIFAAVCLLAGASFGACAAKTTVADTLYNSTQTPLTGTVYVTNTTVITDSGGCVVAANTRVSAAVVNGAFSIALVPNLGSSPTGTSYNVEYHVSSGIFRETWVVPSAGPVTLSAVRALSPPLPTVMIAASQLQAPLPCLANQVLTWNGLNWLCAPAATSGIISINGLTPVVQTMAVGTSGSDFNLNSSGSAHNFNLPTAGGASRGALSSADWTLFNRMSNPVDLNTVWFRDDFVTGSTGGNHFGELRWNFGTIGAVPSIQGVAYDGQEIGILGLTSSAVSGQGGSVWLGETGSFPAVALNALMFDSVFRFKLLTTSTVSMNVGYNASAVTTLNAPNSFFLRYDTGSGDVNFMYVVGANTPVSSGVAVDTNWHTLRVRSTVAGTIKFSLDGGNETSFSSGIPTNNVFPFFMVVTQTTATRTVNLGAWAFAGYNQARYLDQLAFGPFNAFGDSVTQGFNSATTAIGGYASLVAQSYYNRLNNYAVSGTRVGAWAFYQYGSTVSVDSTKTTLSIFGVNDSTPVNSIQGNLDAWKLSARANLLYGAIADADKKKASTWSLSGTWSSVSTGFANYDTWGGKQTSSVGDSASASVNGTVVYLVLMNKDTGDVSYGVTIDGVSKGSFSNTGNSILENGFGGLNVYPVAQRFTGLSAGSHTIAVTYNSGTTPLVLMWAGGNGAPSGKPRYIAGNCIPQQSNANAANISSLNSTFSTTVSELNGDGLKVYLWDANSALPTANTWLWSDSLHPSTIGHYTLGQSAIAVAQANP
jgi:hypothetical protein